MTCAAVTCFKPSTPEGWCVPHFDDAEMGLNPDRCCDFHSHKAYSPEWYTCVDDQQEDAEIHRDDVREYMMADEAYDVRGMGQPYEPEGWWD